MFIRCLTHAKILAFVNLFGIWAGFVVFKLLGSSHQIAIQAPIAFAVSVTAFLLWLGFVESMGPVRFRVQRQREVWWIFALAPIVATIVFVPLHYLVRGYLTSFSNLLGLWAFQIPTNLVAVGIGMAGRGRRMRREHQRSQAQRGI